MSTGVSKQENAHEMQRGQNESLFPQQNELPDAATEALMESELLNPVARTFLRNAMQAAPTADTKQVAEPTPVLKRIWHIHDFLMCPIIGTCLTLGEQKQILKKAGEPVKKMDDYDIHARLVQLAGTENKTATRTETALNRKYRKELATYVRLSEEELCDLWDEQFASGDYAALLWAAAVRTDLSEETMRDLFADIHMQMHTLSEQSRRDRQCLNRLETENHKLSRQVKEQKKMYRDALKDNRLLQEERAEAHRKCAYLEKERLHRTEKTETGTSDVSEELAILKRENELMCSELEGLAESVRFLQQAYDELETENRALRTKKESAKAPEATMAASPPCGAEKQCPACDLCSHRVLVVGGIKKMECFYRKTVENCGGTFEYHDGYMQSGKSELESKVRRADLVLCPVNCNSHGACLMVKRLGKKYGKKVRMLPGSSLSSISQSLWKYEKDTLCEKRLPN